MYDEELSEEVKREYFETNLEAAKIGFVESMRKVAGAYLNGFGVEKNFDAAIKWYEKAFDEGDSSAAVALGEIYQEKNIAKAIFYLTKAAEENNIGAIKKLVGIYETQNNFEKMFEWCQRGANLGNDDFMREVANCYLNGRGVPQDDLKALAWYIKVVEICGCNGDPNDIRMVTKIYNKHFKFSDEKFLGYYVTTEKLGHFNALFGIAAELYKTDKYRALKWYRMADFAGDYDAALAVYHIFTEDLSYASYNITFSHFATRHWYEKAAEFGNINAAKNLVVMNTDKKKSLYWLNKVLEMEAEKLENGLLAVAAKDGGHKNV